MAGKQLNGENGYSSNLLISMPCFSNGFNTSEMECDQKNEGMAIDADPSA